MVFSPRRQWKEPLRGGRNQVDRQPIVEDVSAVAVTAQPNERVQALHDGRAQGVEHEPQGHHNTRLCQGRKPRPLAIRNGVRHGQCDIAQNEEPLQAISAHERRDPLTEQEDDSSEKEPAIPNGYVMQAHDLWQELTAQAQPESGDQYGHTVNRPSEAPQDIAHHKAPEQHGQEPEMPIPPPQQADWMEASRRRHHHKAENEVRHEDVQCFFPDHADERSDAPPQELVVK